MCKFNFVLTVLILMINNAALDDIRSNNTHKSENIKSNTTNTIRNTQNGSKSKSVDSINIVPNVEGNVNTALDKTMTEDNTTIAKEGGPVVAIKDENSFVGEGGPIAANTNKLNLNDLYAEHTNEEKKSSVQARKGVLNDTPTKHKPRVLDGDAADNNESKENRTVLNNLQKENKVLPKAIRKENTEKYSTNVGHPKLVMPVVIGMVALPVFAALAFFALRRGKEAWKNRHYKRMDYLIDGMYND